MKHQQGHGFWSRRIEFLLVCLCSESCAWNCAHAAFVDNGATARLAALGGTEVVIADDAAALVSNPAGLGSLRQLEVISDYSRLDVGLTDSAQISQSYVGGGVPLSIGGTLAGGWQQLNFDNLYTERILSVGYGRWWTPHLALGVRVKQLHLGYSPDNEIIDDFGNIQRGTPDLFAQNGTNRSAYTADLGALYKWNERNMLGLAVQDINEPNIALSDNDRDIVARTIRVGLSSEVQSILTLATAIQTQRTLAEQRDWIWTGGGEAWFKNDDLNQWGLRGAVSAGTREDYQVATGASYRLGAFQMDYAFVFNLGGIMLGDSYGSHRFSMVYRFGKDPTAAPRINLAYLSISPAEDDEFEEDGTPSLELLLKLDSQSPSQEVAYHAP